MRWIVLACLSFVSTVCTAQTPATIDEDLQRFSTWFRGEWNNNEQVWQQKVDAAAKKIDKIDDPIPHTHHIFAPVKAPKVGEHIFYVQQSLDGDLAKVYRQRVYRFTKDEAERAVKLEIFTLQDEKAFLNAHLRPEAFTALDVSALKATSGCDVLWRYDASAKAYLGTMKQDACSFVSSRSGKRVIVNDNLKLSESEIWINDQAKDESGNRVFGSKTDTPIKNRKVRYFTGWVYFNRAGKDAKPEDKTFSSRRDLMIHTEGQKLPLLYEDGTPSPYLIELAQLTYQNTKTPILTLALLDRNTMKSITYIWANTDATRVGMNLGWFQVGLTQKADQPQFGFVVR